MVNYVWFGIALAVLSFLAWRTKRVWVDAGRRGLELAPRLGWSLLSAFAPNLYWWGVRIKAMAPEEQAELVARETQALELSQADSLRCPLCWTEIPHAWTLTAGGRPTVAPGPIECSHCDFRLDACRHCAHFLPGPPASWGQFSGLSNDITSGRCNHYQSWQPVEQVCPPGIARQMKARSYERVRAPRPIVDSFFPPDSCNAFRPDRSRLRKSQVRWPDPRRAALLRVLAPPASLASTQTTETPPADEQWLL
ncbi:MAG: hypothetical protein PVH17_04680 [Anaerolineae bacterium]|jgi:hypothetical protein